MGRGRESKRPAGALRLQGYRAAEREDTQHQAVRYPKLVRAASRRRTSYLDAAMTVSRGRRLGVGARGRKDYSRVACLGLWPDERFASASRVRVQAVRYCRNLEVRTERVIIDNGACYCSRRFAAACRRPPAHAFYTRASQVLMLHPKRHRRRCESRSVALPW